MAEVKPLRPDQEALPYSKYYHRPLAPPNPKAMAELDKGPMDPDKALPIDDINMILDPGYHEVENGYCILPSGMGYLAINNVFPGVTLDMVRWWFVWHAAGGNMRYKIWCPPKHVAIAVADQDRRKILDPSVPFDEKYVDVDHFVVEDIGGGAEDIVISFKRPQSMGFDMDKFKKSPTVEVFGGFGVTESHQRLGQKAPAVMMHTVREIEGGVEFRTRFYMGARLVDGKPKCVLPKGVVLPVQVPMGLAYHNVEEYSNLASFLPEIYAEYGDKPLDYEGA